MRNLKNRKTLLSSAASSKRQRETKSYHLQRKIDAMVLDRKKEVAHYQALLDGLVDSVYNTAAEGIYLLGSGVNHG